MTDTENKINKSTRGRKRIYPESYTTWQKAVALKKTRRQEAEAQARSASASSSDEQQHPSPSPPTLISQPSPSSSASAYLRSFVETLNETEIKQLMVEIKHVLSK